MHIVYPTIKTLRSTFNYDPSTGIFTRKKCRFKSYIGQPTGTFTSDGYLMLSIGRMYFSAHKAAWAYVHGYWPRRIDHINRVRFDNRICNLRKATASQNSQNVGMRSTNTTGYTGVFIDKNRPGVFRAAIMVKRKVYNLGSYTSAEDAFLARCAKGRELVGDYFVP